MQNPAGADHGWLRLCGDELNAEDIRPFRVAPPLCIHEGAEWHDLETFAAGICDKARDKRLTRPGSAQGVRNRGVVRDHGLRGEDRIGQIRLIPILHQHVASLGPLNAAGNVNFGQLRTPWGMAFPIIVPALPKDAKFIFCAPVPIASGLRQRAHQL